MMLPYYRDNLESAIREFRPVLRNLRIRSGETRIVYLADFDNLDTLNIDSCILIIQFAQLKNTDGLYFCSHEDNLLKHYIILNKDLYLNKETESKHKLKIAGVHEFCHFMAMIYTITAVSIESQKVKLIERLNKKTDELDSESLNNLYSILKNSSCATNTISEAEDSHFRLECEGETPNYYLLFKNFLFSRELFEESFTKLIQQEFNKLLHSNNKTENTNGVQLLVTYIEKCATEKDVHSDFVQKQVLTWVKDYL